MSLSSQNNQALVGEAKYVESLCSSCIYSGCGACPSRNQVNFKSNEYPQVRNYYVRGLRLIVTECDNYIKRLKAMDKKKIGKLEFVWDLKTRKFVKKIK